MTTLSALCRCGHTLAQHDWTAAYWTGKHCRVHKCECRYFHKPAEPTPAQERILALMRSGKHPKEMPYNGPGSDGPYWFVFDESGNAFVRCSRQVRALIKLGLVEIGKDRSGAIAKLRKKEP